MTEAEWLAATDAMKLLWFLGDKVSARKVRLIACASVCRFKGYFKDERCTKAIEVMERFADGLATKAELRRARQAVKAAQFELVSDPNRRGEYIAYESVGIAAAEKEFPGAIPDHWYVMRLQGTGVRVARDNYSSSYVREVLGNPFHPITLSPSWLTSTVVFLANQMYDSRDFSPMPILADALQDAGCDNEDILNHCRQPGEHVRGCWVVDLLLDKK
jgi:hypothetical protein